MNEGFLAISYFDQLIGPNLLYRNESEVEDKDFPDLSNILEYNEENGTYIFPFRRYQSINHIFTIKSEEARGGKELLMISYIIRGSFFRNDLMNIFKHLEEKEPILKSFANEISQLENFPKLLHKHLRAPQLGDLRKVCEVLGVKFFPLYEKYYKILISNANMELISKRYQLNKRIFILGPKESGKTKFIKNAETIQFYNQKKPDLSTKIIEFILENLIIPEYKDLKSDLSLEKAQGIIYIVQFENETVFEQFESELFYLIKYLTERKGLRSPLLVVINISNKEQRELIESKIQEKVLFDNLKLKSFPIKFEYIDFSKEDKRIMESIRWLIRNII
ncbi:MAG: hypothetical protein GF383_03025 [Candidatus Lokiarchaeota archaeon]|nr:hypothetical protein [Candidatus Lokiarchaeota archaeon]MBD3338512.1 hypothetical protein [Candidatus Lokiarchaeota archaeon]